MTMGTIWLYRNVEEMSCKKSKEWFSKEEEFMRKTKTDDKSILQSLVDIAVESWRFKKVFERAISKLDFGDQERYNNQFAYFTKKVDSAVNRVGVKIVNIEGQTFDVGMAVTPLNIDDFNNDEQLRIDRMVEPIIMKDNSVIRIGTVILGRKHQ